MTGHGKRMSFSNDGPSDPQKDETRLVTAGRDTKAQKGFVNPAVFHGSTVLYPSAEDLHAHRGGTPYTAIRKLAPRSQPAHSKVRNSTWRALGSIRVNFIGRSHVGHGSSVV
jgi:cystathionine beta-lyase/cystathionine gamma-synthase